MSTRTICSIRSSSCPSRSGPPGTAASSASTTIKTRLRKEAQLLADPDRLDRWARTHHGGDVAALSLFADRAPLFVFAGDVGCGKTALAESFGCDLADRLKLPVFLYRLKLATRGSGLVGEMTTLIGDAFAAPARAWPSAREAPAASAAVLVLVVDEADALAQSREAQQMHHEDRAGVDAFLAGVDSLAGAHVPVLVVLCTNRVGALDPAVMRRAAAIFNFARPDDDQRRVVLTDALVGFGIGRNTIERLVQLTGPDASADRVTRSLTSPSVLCQRPYSEPSLTVRSPTTS